MRRRERERDARVVRGTKNKESAFVPVSLPNDVITDMADCGEEEDDTKRKKRKKETHCRTRGGSSFGSI
jgi:hypothetical protein